MMQYRELSKEECGLIIDIDRREFIERVWRLVDGQWILKRIDWQEEDWPGGVATYIRALQQTLDSGGSVFGAFDDNGKLRGVASLNREFFGTTARYVLLDNMFVSQDSRGKGIGKQLTELCKARARGWGADKLYACAASSEATIAFYKGMGFVCATELNQALYDLDHRDIQLELGLK